MSTRTRIFLLLGLSFFCLNSNAQEVSVLPQYLSMNPLIKRDPIFVELQSRLQNLPEEGGLKFGLDEKMKKLRNQISDIKIILSNDNRSILLTYRIFNENDKKELVKFPENYEVGVLLDTWKEGLVEEILKGFDSEFGIEGDMEYSELSSDSKRKLFMISFISSLLTNTSISYLDFKGSKYGEIRSTLKENLNALLNKYVFSSFKEDIINDEQIDKLIADINYVIENFKERIIDTTYDIESEIQKLTKYAEDKLVAANAGFGIGEEEGNIGGGIFVTVKSDKNEDGYRSFEAAVFISGVGEIGAEEESADSLVSQPFLAGANLKFRIKKNQQLDFIAAVRENQEEISGQKRFWEIGAGYMWQLNGGILLGASAFYQMIDKDVMMDVNNTMVMENIPSIFTLGVTLQSNTPNSPIIVLGATIPEGGSVIPNIQLSYPIGFN